MTEREQLEILSRPATFVRAAIVNGAQPAFALLDSDGMLITYANSVHALRRFAEQNGIDPPETVH